MSVARLLFAGAMLSTGVLLLVFANAISRWEKSFGQGHPWYRVTSWGGTKKGVIAWRVAAVLCLIGGLVNLAIAMLD